MNNYVTTTDTTFGYTSILYYTNTNTCVDGSVYVVYDEIIIKDKIKYGLKKQIGNYSNPKIKKKEYSRLICRRG